MTSLDAVSGNRSSSATDAPDVVRVAADRAACFFFEWSRQNGQARLGAVQRLADLLERDAAALAARMADELGKPVRFGRVEAMRTAQKLRAIAARAAAGAEGQGTGGQQTGSAGDGWVLRRRPHGVVAVVTPYNNPIYLSLGKIAAAVLYGNTVVWKPAAEARALSDRLRDMLEEAGWPPGLVNLVPGGPEEAQRLMHDRAVSAVTITGSESAGRAAQEICGRRHIPLQAELGGNNAAIVWSDADLEHAARAVAGGAFEMAGQRCTANRRVVVDGTCHKGFLQRLVTHSRELCWGDPLEPSTQIGPLVSIRHAERVAAAVERAGAAGHESVFPLGAAPPGAAAPGRQAWFPPTIIVCDDSACEIVQQETFGPVLVVQPARDWDHAIGLCNGVRQGLCAAIFSRSPERIGRFLAEAQAGILKVNQSTADAAVDVPFGGWKASGIGLPEHGVFDMEFYTRLQTVYGAVRGQG